ncbi:MAG TPA: DNA-3-methyladenine glycosylase [Candidatus Saccharimonadales bacterium]|nr:DNA-3-methyladenine glycosylase [Candidatus Saccharimonadales bacterium]
MTFKQLSQDSWVVAPKLLGSLLIRELDCLTLVGKIVEVEAYDQFDAASHGYKGKTPRTEVMFGQAGHSYVYFTYGMHYCMNIVTGSVGHGSAVLIRALEPVEGIEQMRLNREGKTDHELSNGPAKLCQALKIDRAFNGHDLTKSPLMLKIVDSQPNKGIIQTTRIGISREQNRKWRWYIKDNKFVSKLAK